MDRTPYVTLVPSESILSDCNSAQGLSGAAPFDSFIKEQNRAGELAQGVKVQESTHGSSQDKLQESALFSTWVLGTELKPLGVVASAFTRSPILPATCLSMLNNSPTLLHHTVYS